MLQRARVEMQEAAGNPPMQEPRRFGGWQRGAPHPTIPWAWQCTNAAGNTATVELHFARDVEYGTHLRKAVAANADLMPLGAEHLIDSNRLILRPNEAWVPDPGRPFNFWIARESAAPSPLAQLTLAETRQVASVLQAMIEAAKKHNLKLPLRREQVSIAPGGHVVLHRPGLDLESGDPEGDALTLLLELPLDTASRAVVSQAMSLKDLVPETPTSDNTMILQRPGADTTVIGRPDTEGTVMTPRPAREPSPPPSRRVCANCNAPLREGLLFCNDCGYAVGPAAPTVCPRCNNPVTPGVPFCPRCGERVSAAPAAAPAATPSGGSGLAAVGVGLRSLDGDRGDYELIINNTGTSLLALNLSAADGGAGLFFEFMPDVMVGPGITRRIPLRVSSDWDGWPKEGTMVPFSIFVYGAAHEQPRRVDGELFAQGVGSSGGGSQTVLMYVACVSIGLAAGLGVVLFMFR